MAKPLPLRHLIWQERRRGVAEAPPGALTESMQSLLVIIVLLGVTPAVLGLVRSDGQRQASLLPTTSSWLLYALAFNLMFFWQELWLVIPKAVTPGLSPVLFHNNHTWDGDAPIAELLQAAGAVGTAFGGLVSLLLLVRVDEGRPTWRLFLFWMAFQGLFQSLSQVAIGCVIPGNDVGRALAYLQLPDWARWGLLTSTAVAMAASGVALARLSPFGLAKRARIGSRPFAIMLLSTALLSLPLIALFRVPRSVIEVAVIPGVVGLLGTAWLILGASFIPAAHPLGREGIPRAGVPAIALIVLLLVFQLLLRPGVRF